MRKGFTRGLTPFANTGGKPRKALGGSTVESDTAKQMARDQYNGPSLGAKIYIPPAIKNMDQDDPRYQGKSDNVENIYVAAPQPPAAPRSGVAQILNWFFHGELK